VGKNDQDTGAGLSSAGTDFTTPATLLFEHIEGQINRADTKAQLVLTADALLITAFTLSGSGITAAIAGNTAAARDIVSGVAELLVFVALITSIYFAIAASRPILHPPSQRCNLFFFGHIAQLDEQTFIDTFTGQSEAEMRTSILAQVYAKSLIADHKFASVGRSTNFLIAALVLWAVMRIALVFLL
jgi:disulfide bond formation protein DsbB